MQDSGFQIHCDRRGPVVIAAAGGRVDHTNAEAFRAALWPTLDGCTEPGDAVVLDLGGLEYISSAGLRILMLAARRATEQGGRLVVAAMQPVVREIFEITRFDKLFRLYDSVGGAVDALSAPH